MKKLRVFSLLLTLTLLTGLLSPYAAASGSGSAILDGMQVQAKAAILVDADYDEVLYEQNAHEKMYPASITKVMTCLLTLEAVDRAREALEAGVTPDALLTDVEEALAALGELTGQSVREDVTDRIFQRFCVGK